MNHVSLETGSSQGWVKTKTIKKMVKISLTKATEIRQVVYVETSTTRFSA